ncbi:arylsulfotransferase [Kipferlia bialata]|uniref:Arylsulfotransferase n=1 Tax=Kipferlia bialata TaxID=797122 RepID=A0A9K3CT07_9EUKA|nr:arylsulfotransferase [Kipferlia bialata]|eukprot:g3822.t1
MCFFPYELDQEACRGEGDMLPQRGFLYNTAVLDDMLNFAEAPSRTWVSGEELENPRQIPHPIAQPDDSHEMGITPRGNLLVLIYRMHEAGKILTNGETLALPVTSCYLVERDNTGTTVWEWDSIDHIYPDPDPATCYQPTEGFNYHDYFHCNCASFNESDPNELILTGRYMRGCVSVDYATGKVNWILANPSNPLNQFTYPGDALMGPASVHGGIMRGNTLYIFDNGDYPTDPYLKGSRLFGRAPTPCVHEYSRVVEYQIDAETHTATYIRQTTLDNRIARISGYIQFIERGKGEEENMLLTWGSQVFIHNCGFGKIYKTNIDHWY